MIEFDQNAIKKTREMIGMTQQELAQALGCSRQRVCQYENDSAVMPTLKTMLKIWKALGVTDPRPFFKNE